jgi:asparaginyl-tRNA synthetase
VVRFPTAIKFFNMRIDPADPLTVLSADLILPTAGETVGAAVRESDYDALLRRLHESTMWDALRARGVDAARAFAPYLRLIETGATPPHAGYGLGLDRLLQYIIGVNDIRSASATYRLATRGAETS